MRAILVVLLLLLHATASAQPAPASCYPALGARGVVMDVTPDGQYGAWWCLRGYDWRMVRAVARAGFAPAMPRPPAGALELAIAQAYWAANVNFNCGVPQRNDPALLRLCDAAHNAALDTKPLPPWVVRTNGTSPTRPTYQVTNGVRSTVSNGTIGVLDAWGRATACDPALKAGSYMRVKGADTVALCSPSP